MDYCCYGLDGAGLLRDVEDWGFRLGKLLDVVSEVWKTETVVLTAMWTMEAHLKRVHRRTIIATGLYIILGKFWQKT